MQIRLSNFAEADLDDIHAYLAAHHVSNADHLINEIIRYASRLSSLPHMGRIGRVAGTRELSIPDLPYFLVYTLSDETVDIERVLHSRRKYPSHSD